MGERERTAIEAARAEGPFRSIEDFARRTRLDSGRLSRLAEGGAFASFEPRRRNALWEARAVHPGDAPELGVQSKEAEATFAPLTDFETIHWDYETANLSTHGHPLQPMRAELAAHGLPDARTVNAKPHGSRVRYAGVVINRQRPGTAGGVTFMTLEDETGFVNLVVWRQVFDEYRVVVKTSPFLGVTGKLQVESGVVHLIAEELWVPVLKRQPRSAGSRDFH
jgi:error-prone DNA polymerase